MSDFPIYIKIEDIEDYCDDLVFKDEIIKYLIYLRDYLVKVCYRWNDDQIEDLINISNLSTKYERIPYYPVFGLNDTHISRSEYITFLRELDDVTVPFIRQKLLVLSPESKEDESKIIKNYPLFNFDYKHILDYSESLKKDKLEYLTWILDKYNYVHKINNYYPFHMHDFNGYIKDDFHIEVEKRISALKRYPNMKHEKYSDTNKILSESRSNKMNEYFNSHPDLYWFTVGDIKKHAANLPHVADRIIYLEYVAKELQLHKEYEFPFEIEDINLFLDLEIKYYKKIEPYKSQSITDNITPIHTKDPIRLHWQDDNALIPYLIKLLFDENFISISDLENRRDFIQQSFFKNNGKIFEASEVAVVEHNNNNNPSKKPSKAFKVERVIEKLKSKREELNQKPKRKTKK